MPGKPLLRPDIDLLLSDIDQALESKIETLMIGGGAMALRGQKTATKDIDLVFTEAGRRESFIAGIAGLGFRSLLAPGEAYRKMGARIYRDAAGRWLDLFGERICNMFLVHEGVLARATEHLSGRRLRVLLMSPEDIFLSKSVTERDGDLQDMRILYDSGLDVNRIFGEVAFQAARTDKIWESFLAVRLGEFEEKFDMTVPFKARFEEIAVRKMEERNRKEG